MKAADHTLETKTSDGLTCAWLAARYSGWTGTLEVLKAEGADLKFAHRYVLLAALNHSFTHQVLLTQIRSFMRQSVV